MVECFHAVYYISIYFIILYQNDAYYKKLDDEARAKSLQKETDELLSDFDKTNPSTSNISEKKL